ncbi:hypothetical protein QBC32DRAFT_143305 [Pseudoneurospora amorphoporcata]|uniref:Uncharacterized protein n=1 Tax=Pseudoneurospora amorphoporcata TaxID=241081 RepID=A0AAN6SFJ1_9PEZI|nr:hypothetical protein QBC32DRAFT_143305 [Pseudoneurospora amorphoporcata]
MPPITTVTRFVHAVTHQKRGPPFDGEDIDATSPDTGRKRLIIILSSAISVVALLSAAIVICLCLCWRKKQRRIRLFSRTVTPVDDEEIATWKTPKSEEAGFTTGDNTDVDRKSRPTTGDRLNTSHGKQPSTSSVKKPASVIVYNNPQDQAAGETRKSLDEGSPRFAAHSTHSGYYGKTSIDHTPLPPTPILARAPNSRAGLTDETVPGDVPFIPAPKRQPSRLYKLPPGVHAVGPSSPRSRHGRKRSSKSSTSSIGGYSTFHSNNYNRAAYYRGGGYTSDTGGGGGGRVFPGRYSHDHARTHSMNHHHSHLHSGVTVPPRLSLGDDARLSRRQFLREEEIGRAIG